ncbi:hypothetical protein A5731_11020 [Mycolicibacterium conceptionense]|uniref:Intersectin-EH binding protein Ibp1 n=5 Tax=Mycolicibacterium TaxID=1866885 RepID=A0A0J8UEL4_9MYCO|nr:hypothetical protein AA982_10725 [Mycolicibacterium senegalense]KMV18775.1 hypothetical protein ACT17_10280 [Mycolicibacterium conceptionense]KLO50608.1 hypothetical protein ABW05_02905 [Mycolicibacterium senegalense]OBB03985.1 hypothetical protein A5718_26705 [Mycolicibacterium conceptionense]OBF05006.1 hypothetical protein A5731_11020 [Mycolicibacterium conceptionense]
MAMSKPLLFVTQILAAVGAAGAVALGSTASAEEPPAPCTETQAATVCQGPGSASVVVSPPGQSHGTNGQTPQNGPYGPSGQNPPVG